ncbi:MAG: carboxypeptidase-like regulatory domain-containing protein [Planctomycetota bacterium]
MVRPAVSKKVLVAGGAALACGLLAWLLASLRPTLATAAAPTEPGSSAAAPTVAPGPPATAPAAPEAVATLVDRRALGTHVTTGALRVSVFAVSGDQRLPLDGVPIEVWPAKGDPASPADDRVQRRSDARGEVTLPELAVGTWNARVAGMTDGPSTAAEVAASAETGLELVLTASWIAHGRVVDADGAPVGGADLWVQTGNGAGRAEAFDIDELEVRHAGVSDRNGRFVVPFVAREQVIAATHPQHAASRSRFVGNGRAEPRLVLGRAPATLTVTVRDAEGATLAGAVVRLGATHHDTRRTVDGALVLPRVARLARTDAAGVCVFEGLAPVLHHLRAVAWPHAPTAQTVTLAPFARAEVALVLGDGITVTGSVRDAAGAPVRARVCSRATPDARSHWSQCDTGADGSFELPYQPRRSLFVVALARGSVVAQREIVDPPPGVVRCDLVTEGHRTLRGRVVSAAGAALAGWRVTATDAEGTAHPERSGSDGSFAILAAPSSTWTCTAAPPDGAPTPAVTVTGNGTEPLELRVPEELLPSAALRGRLLDADGMPVAGRFVRLALGGGDGTHRQSTAADGTFAFERLVAGTWRLAHSRGGYWIDLRDVELAPSQDLAFGDVVLPATAKLHAVLVHDDGRPWQADMPGIGLRRDDGSDAEVVQAPVAGGLDVTAAPGSYRLVVFATDLVAPTLAVRLVAGETTTVRVPLTLGRTCTLTFDAGATDKARADAPLEVTVRAANGEAVLRQPARRRNPRGGGSWMLHVTLPLGRYEVEARDDRGLAFRGALEAVADVDAATEIAIPRQQ